VIQSLTPVFSSDPSSPDDLTDHPQWQRVEQEFSRAERLLEAACLKLQEHGEQNQQERARVGLELEQALAPLQQLCAGLGQVIEAMAQERQDNRIQRWQGELQQLLLPVDEAQLQLQQVILQLEMPLAQAWQGKPLRESRPMIQKLQLQQLLAQRQRQVQQLQAEVRQLRGELFLALSSQSVLADGGGADAAATEPSDAIPSIFSP
jgi:hypothetical protein